MIWHFFLKQQYLSQIEEKGIDFSVFNPKNVFPAACELTKWIQNKFSAPCQHKRGKSLKSCGFPGTRALISNQYVQIHVDDCIAEESSNHIECHKVFYRCLSKETPRTIFWLSTIQSSAQNFGLPRQPSSKFSLPFAWITGPATDPSYLVKSF